MQQQQRLKISVSNNALFLITKNTIRSVKGNPSFYRLANAVCRH